VLDAITGKELHAPVVHQHRDVNDDLAARLTQDLPEAFVKIEFGGSVFKACCLCFPGVCFLHFLFKCCSHGISEVARVECGCQRKAWCAAHSLGGSGKCAAALNRNLSRKLFRQPRTLERSSFSGLTKYKRGWGG
jgi:hypothetical protein